MAHFHRAEFASRWNDYRSTKAQADTPTRWEDMNNFKQLLDVMLPADQQPPIWPS